MSHYKRYPKYKPSGVEWLGEIPEHWHRLPIKALASWRDGIFIDGDWIESKNLSTGGIRYLTSGNVGSGAYKEQGSGYISEETFSELKCTEVVPGDILVSRLNLPIGRACVVPDLGGRIVTAVDNVIFRPGPDYSREYIVFRFSALDYFHEAENLSGGATMQRISRTELGNIRVAFPPLSDQKEISRVVKRELGRIDALISKKSLFIDLLKERRQALITHAVTKGLDPKVKMKDSGVEWIGEVPSHWSVPKLRHVATVQTGVAKGKDSKDKDTVEVPYLRVANVQDGYLDLTNVAMISIPKDELSNYLLKPGDVLMNEGGDNDKVGRGHVWNTEIPVCIHQNHVFAVRPTGVTSDWLNTYTGTSPAQFFFISRAKQSTNLASISSSNLMDLPVPQPPMDEQNAITSMIKRIDKRLAALRMATERSVALLVERRSALITAAVTGQIDLRDAS